LADTITLNPGTGGSVVATDDIAGVHYQRVKVNYGADGSSTDVDATHGLPVRGAAASTATLSNVAASATNVTLLSSNSSRLGAMVFNDSSATLSLKFGATATSTSFTVQVPPGGYFEFPQPIYTGIVDGIWDSATGNARLTEMT
jgi:hypothetical protein